MAVPQIKYNPLMNQLVGGLMRGIMQVMQNRQQSSEAQKQREFIGGQSGQKMAWDASQQMRQIEAQNERARLQREAMMNRQGLAGSQAMDRNRFKMAGDAAQSAGDTMRLGGAPAEAARAEAAGPSGRYISPQTQRSRNLGMSMLGAQPQSAGFEFEGGMEPMRSEGFGLPGMPSLFKPAMEAPLPPEQQGVQYAEGIQEKTDPAKLEEARQSKVRKSGLSQSDWMARQRVRQANALTRTWYANLPKVMQINFKTRAGLAKAKAQFMAKYNSSPEWQKSLGGDPESAWNELMSNVGELEMPPRPGAAIRGQTGGSTKTPPPVGSKVYSDAQGRQRHGDNWPTVRARMIEDGWEIR